MHYEEFKSLYQKFNDDSDKENFLQNYVDEDMSEELANFPGVVALISVINKIPKEPDTIPNCIKNILYKFEADDKENEKYSYNYGEY